MIDTKKLRAKYAKKKTRNGVMQFPAGGQDVYELCDAVDSLRGLLRDIQRRVPIELQNEIETRMLFQKK